MAFFTRKRIIIGGIILLIVGGLIARQLLKTPESNYITETVKRGDVIQTVQATGTVESANEIALSFGTSGRITSLPVKIGDKVRTGQLLASLDTSSLNGQIASSRANLQAQQASLARLLAGSTKEDVAVSQAAVDSAQSALDNAQTQHRVQISAQLSTLRASVEQQLFNALTAISTADKIISNQDYNTRIGAKDFATKNDAKNQLLVAKNAVDGAQVGLAVVQFQDIPTAQTAVNQTVGTLRIVASALTASYETLVASTTDAGFTETTLDGYKNAIQAQQQTLKSGIVSLETSVSQLSTTDATLYAQVVSAQRALDSTIAQFKLKTASATPETIAQQRAAVNAAAATLQSLQSQLRNYVLYAPVDGVISQRNNEVGEQVVGGTVLAIVGESDSQVRVDVPEADVAKIHVGDKATMTFDAFGRDRVFEGSVSLIDPAATKIQDATYYRVKVSFNEKQPDIRSGMTADVTVHTSERLGVIMIPQRAVREDAGKRYVQVISGPVGKETVENRDVVLGLRGDGGVVEAAGGVDEGAQVVVGTKTVAK